MPSIPDALVLDAVLRHSLRAAMGVHRDLARGISSLATIAATAPFLGVLVTVPMIVSSFVGCGGERSACMAAVVLNLSNAIVPTALGLIVAIPAFCFYKCLTACLESFHLEMNSASLELRNRLSTVRPT